MASASHSNSMLLKSNSDETQKLEEFMAHLQQERLKIQAFKRELPLCMHLLTNAMEESKRQLQSCKASTEAPTPLLEEFLPTNNNSSERLDKSHWMTSVQLWNTPSHANFQQKPPPPPPELALAAVGQESSVEIKCFEKPANSNGARRESNACRMNQANRKARRCWSPDLHRRFLNALQMLGGSEVATPKQIRELMKVDGLTNDEVKSHLQKYRLHSRRPSSSSMAAEGGGHPTPLVVVGGIWVPPEYAAAAPMIYAPHPTMHASSHYCVSTAAPTQEFYHRQLLHQFHVYKASSSRGSPDSDIKATLDAAGGKSETTEDGKSDSSYQGERKRLAAMRVAETEDCHDSQITFKF